MSFFFSKRKIGKTRERLAAMIDELLKREFPGRYYDCQPEDLKVNHGSSRYTDWCSWTCYVTNINKQDHPMDLCSWSTMGSLCKYKHLTFVTDEKELGPREIEGTNELPSPPKQ